MPASARQRTDDLLYTVSSPFSSPPFRFAFILYRALREKIVKMLARLARKAAAKLISDHFLSYHRIGAFDAFLRHSQKFYVFATACLSAKKHV